MKITILSETDYAGSGFKLYEALKRSMDIRMFAEKYYNPFNHPELPHSTKRDIQRRVDQSDIVHLKGDFPPNDVYMGIKIAHKPIIVSVSGSLFRKKKYWGFEKYNFSDYDKAKIKTAFTPDLLYPGFSNLWTPHPIDSKDKAIEWKRSAHPVLMHTPTSKEKKDTAFIQAVFSKISRRMRVETVVLEKVPFKRVLEERKEATIFFDQFKVGFYGNSAIEAMQYGIPVAAWISPMAIEQGRLTNCPVISDVKSVDIWAKMIEQMIDGDLEGISVRTKEWCDKVHSYEAIAKLWKGIYESI